MRALRHFGAAAVFADLDDAPTGLGIKTQEAEPARRRLDLGERRGNQWHVDWRRLARRTFLASLLLVGVIVLYYNARRGHQFGLDFRGGMWKAGHDILAGRSPYPPPSAHALITRTNLFVLPPFLGLLAIPFSLLPWAPAAIAWTVLSVALFCAALFLLGVRDRAVYVVALCSFPFVASLDLGQTEALLALGLAVVWRYRDSWVGAVVCGAVIAAKLLAWPLLLWLLVTRRFRSCAVAIGSAVALLVASWAIIGFRGFANYPRLLATDARVFGKHSHSVLAWAVRLGASEQTGRWLAVACACVVALAVVRASRGSDAGYFAAAIIAGLLSSPLLWSHYLVFLFIPLAIARPRLDAAWLIVAGLWLFTNELPRSWWQVALVLASATCITILAARGSRQRSIAASRV